MFNIINLKEVTSTMDVIKNYPVNTIVVADRQTKGRGKNDREWISNESENLYISLSVESKNKNVNYSYYTFLSSVVVIEAIKSLITEDINIKSKWPNDVLVNGKKFCGILLERDLQRNFIVIGIGINVNSHPELIDKMLFKPTNLLEEGISIKKEEILEKFVNIFEEYSNRLLNEGFEWLRKEWLKYAYNLGKEINVKLKDLQVNGIFEDIDKDGTLLIMTEAGIAKILSGDIF